MVVVTNWRRGDSHATIVGGSSNTITGDHAFIGGGNKSFVEADFSTIAGGQRNTIASYVVDSGWC